ncbi:MAG: 16S rRNA (cytidine(1402)-2'-O)-methyltransferase [Clostridia bacterium]|nr:16S rRNA (cytidine(1402)-2'-O)-methyltransferase [Clostridia bacterium]
MAKLYVVATPIGNLDDLTPRMAAVLKDADLIASEDTRVTLKLLNRLDIRKPMLSCHRHNETQVAPQLVRRMQEEDLTVALTCDAGTPGISDPGHVLVDLCWEAGIPVEPICGPSAVVTALSCSGFDAREFSFFGFLPREGKALDGKLEAIHRGGTAVCVLFESPHRILNLLEAIGGKWPACRVCVCSDLTKRYERVYRGGISEVLAALKGNPSVEKGEYCVVVDLSMVPPRETHDVRLSPVAFLLEARLRGQSGEEAFEAALQAGYARNEIYRAKLEIKKLLDEG